MDGENKPLKVVVELDLANEGDRQLIEIITRCKAAQSEGRAIDFPTIVGSMVEKPGVTSVIVSAAEEMSETVSRVMRDPSVKLTTKERASVAARARWERHRAGKETSDDEAPQSRPKKAKAPKKPRHDLRNAHEEDHEEYEHSDADEASVFNGSSFVPPPPAPAEDEDDEEAEIDGRDLLEGNFE